MTTDKVRSEREKRCRILLEQKSIVSRKDISR